VLVERYVMLQGETVSEPQLEWKIGWHEQERFSVSSEEQILRESIRIVN
jgi:hypothetical protein